MATISCQVPSNENTLLNEYAGNRGITLIIDDFLAENLANAVPSKKAVYSQINMASYYASNNSPKTIWLKGFLVPLKTSKYEFDIESYSNAVLFISKDASAAKKVSFFYAYI